MARHAPTKISHARSAHPKRFVRWAPRTAAIASRSSFRVTASSTKAASSAVTVEVCGASRYCSISSGGSAGSSDWLAIEIVRRRIRYSHDLLQVIVAARLSGRDTAFLVEPLYALDRGKRARTRARLAGEQQPGNRAHVGTRISRLELA